MKLSLIVAMDRNGLIGKDGGLPWGRIPEDMKLFRELTMGHVLIMGRKTFESIAVLGRPYGAQELESSLLHGRHSVVLSSGELPYSFHDANSMPDLKMAQAMVEIGYLRDSAFVIGGAQTYAAFRDLITEAHVTLIDGEYTGDTCFPFPILGSPEWAPLAEPRTLAPGVVYHHLGRVSRS